jgi:hypothetical protein
MEPPDLDPLNLSDSDSDALFDTPAAKKSKKKGNTGGTEVVEGGASGKARGKESHYTAEEAREAQLRQELENVRNVNKVIEGVVESLQKARDNMDVCFFLVSARTPANEGPDGITDSTQCIHPAPDMDSYPLANGTQPAPDLESAMARREPGSYRHPKRGNTAATGRTATRGRGTS